MSTIPASPLAIGRVALTVNDAQRASTFYQQVIGLHLLGSDGENITLGAGGKVLLELRQDKMARRRSPREAGLFHTAFLLPSRAALGRWIQHAIDNRIPVSGASDHLVSEALYLSDPEGNGIEIYADRPSEGWKWRDGTVEMSTEALDIESILRDRTADGQTEWQGFPDGSVVGHVHLQVGTIPQAEAFYAGTLGFDITSRYPGGTFYAVNGYHHHLATNVWNSRGAAEREYPSTGLADVEILAGSAFTGTAAQKAGKPAPDSGDALELRDPWGTAITLSVASENGKA